MDTPRGRPGHPCVGSGCDHPDADHVATPELAAPAETVVWCTVCRRHEVSRPWRFLARWRRTDRPRARRRFSRPG
ncbi:MAG: hypothetical protein ACRECT_00350 [Thermoplasmata archaeon]